MCSAWLATVFGLHRAQSSRAQAEGHRNSDHACDLPIHESILVPTTHVRRGSSMPETLKGPQTI